MVKELKTLEISIWKDQIQEKETICIGWLMGTHPKVVNPGDLIKSIKDFSFVENAKEKGQDNPLKLLDIEIRMQLIRIQSNEKLD